MLNKVLIVGDEIIDRYSVCKATRLSPEAPVPVLVRQDEKCRISAGGGALVRDNLAALGIESTCLWGSVSHKERFFAGGQMVCRVDADSVEVRDIEQQVLSALPSTHAIVISDYGKGGVTEWVADMLVVSGKACFVDTKNSHIEWFSGPNVTLFPNEHEYSAHVKGKEHLFGSVIAKLGENGCRVWDGALQRVHVPAKKREVRDVCGAGDVFMATYVWAMLSGMSSTEAAIAANEAAGISVEHAGTYILSPQDISKLHRSPAGQGRSW